MRAAVQHVHHRYRQDVRVGAADVPVQREPVLLGDGLGCRERDTEQRVGTEARLVVGAVERARAVASRPRWSVASTPTTASRISLVHVVDGLGDALAAVARVAVAELDRLVGTGAGPARHGGPAARARDELDLHLDGGVAAGVEDLPADDVLDKGHDAVAPVDSVATVDGHHP